MKYRIPKSAVEVRLTPYRHTLFFVDSRKKMERCCPHVGEMTPDTQGCSHVCTCNGGAIFIIGVFNGRADTLVHELAHVVFNLFDLIGQPVNASTSEAFAYLQQWIFEQLEPHLK